MKTAAFFRAPFRLVLLSFIVFLVSCDDGKLNIFSVNDDIEIGEEVTMEILNNPDEYPVLDMYEHPEVYAYVHGIRDKILASDDIRFKDRFDWNVYIIDKDVFNAFAVPGGNTFYYTGLIKFVDNEAAFSGVMAHEIAHADRRHSTNRLTKIYGYQMVLSMILGNDPNLAAQILSDLALTTTALAFSRQDEFEADEYAVRYLYPTEIDSRGVAYFFEKMDNADNPDWMTYFSTHPPDSERIEEVYSLHEELGGDPGNTFENRYQDFKNLLP